MLILLGNPGSANDLIAKAFSLSESVHHFKGAECDKVQSVARSAKLFMDDLPAEGTISVEAALGMLKQKQTKFYCGAGFKLEPEWTNNLFYTHNEHLKPLNSIRKLVAGNFGVNTYRNHKHTDIWPQHFDFWKTSIDKIHSIIENSLDHEGKPTDFSKRYVFAEYGNFHWFSQAFPDADLIFPKWRNQMHFAHFYHLRQYGHARDTDNLNNRDVDSHSTVNVGFAQELIKRSKESLVKVQEEISKKLIELGVEDTLINLKGMTQGMLVTLGQKNIKKLKDFADLSTDELVGGYDEVKGKKVKIDGYLEEFSLTREEADQLIMSARNIVFK